MKQIYYCKLFAFLLLLTLFSKLVCSQTTTYINSITPNTDSVEFDQYLYAFEVPGALKYEFLVQETKTSIYETVLKDESYFTLNELTANRVYGGNYIVKVRAYLPTDTLSYGMPVLFNTIEMQNYAYGHILVKIRPGYSGYIQKYNPAIGDTLVFNIPGFDNIENDVAITGITQIFSKITDDFPQLRYNYRITFNQAYSNDSLIAFLQSSDMFEYSHKSYIKRPDTNDPLSVTPGSTCFSCPSSTYYQWYLDAINSNPAFNEPNSGNFTVNVAIIDDAIDVDHEDLRGNIWINQGELTLDIITNADTDSDGRIDADELITYLGYPSLESLLNAAPATLFNDLDNDSNGYVDDICGWDITNSTNPDGDNNPLPVIDDFANWSHGTHVAGIAGAVTNNNTGMASLTYNNINIIPIKGFHDTLTVIGSGFVPNIIIDGINYAVAAGAKIINMSFGVDGIWSYEQTEHDLISTLSGAGIIFIASAGNADGVTHHYPASYDSVIAVGNVDNTNTIYGNNANFIDVYAPGVNIVSTIVHPTELYGCKNGTSMSTPLVSSLYALLLSHNENLSTEELNNCIFNNCATPPYNALGANGQIRAYESLMCILGRLEAEFIYPEDELGLCTGTAVGYFEDYSSGVFPATFSWSCVSCNPADYSIDSPTSADTEITFFNEGDYEIQLVVANDTLIDSITHIVQVRDAYIERLSDSLTTICGDEFEYIAFQVHIASPPFTIDYSINSTNHTLNTSSSTVLIPVSGNGVLTINSVSDTLSCSVSNLGVNAYFESVDCGCYTKHNNNWHFGDNLHLGFNSNPVLDGQSDMQEVEASATMSDAWGNTLFYTNGETVFEPNGTQHQLFDFSGIWEWTPAQTLILPIPNTTDQYAIFSPSNQNSISGLPNVPMLVSYVTYNTVLNQIEEITTEEMPVPADVFLVEKVIWVPKAGSDNIWVICRSDGDNNLHVFELSETGITAHPNNPFVFPGNHYNKRGSMKASPTNDVVAEVFFDITEGPSSEGAIRFYSFNNSTGDFINYSENSSDGYDIIKSPWGCEFSPTGSRFYYTRQGDDWIFSTETINSGNIGSEDLKPFEVAWANYDMVDYEEQILPTNLQRKGNAIYIAQYNSQAILGVMTNTDTDNPYIMPTSLMFSGVNTGEKVHWGLPLLVPERESFVEIAQSSTGCDSCNNLLYVDYYGVDNYSVQWSNSSTADTLYNVCVGETYSVTVTNLDLNCSDSTTLVVESMFMALDSLQMYSNCDSSTNEMHVYFHGGAAPYIIQSNTTTDTIISNHFIDLNANDGSNNLTITDANNCVIDTTITFSIDTIDVQLSQTGTNYCSSENNVIVVAVASGGNPDYTYEWGNYMYPMGVFGTNDTTPSLPSYPEHLYATVTDEYGCYTIDSILIPSTIPAADLDIDVVYPCGSTAGSIDLTITNIGTITDLYWLVPNGSGGVDTISNQQDLTNVVNEGFYRVFVTDEYGCEYFGITEINLYTEPMVQQPSCSWNVETGTILTNWDIAEDHGHYGSYNWLVNSSLDSIPEVNGVFENLPGDTYILYHTDDSGCTMTDTITILEIDPLEYSVSVDYYSDTLGHPMFTSTISVWGESLPYDVLDIYASAGPVISCDSDIEFEVINDTAMPAEYEVSGYLSDCLTNHIDSLPYFVLFGASTNSIYDCDFIDIYIFDSIPDFHDTIYLDTIIKPTKCLASGTGGIEIFNISTEENLFPVIFVNAAANDTIYWYGDTAQHVIFDNFNTGTHNITYWNAYSSVNTINFTIDTEWDITLSGNYSSLWNSYSNQTIAVEDLTLLQNGYMDFTNCTIYTAVDTYTDIDETEWVVQKDAKILLKESTIQSGCPQKWKGITVEGTATSNQNPSTAFVKGQYHPNQGYVVVAGTLIRDAEYGVYLESGGVINTTSSDYQNNLYSIYFEPYGYNLRPAPVNRSIINDNEFIIDSMLHPTTLTGTDRRPNGVQIRVDQISGLSILGNKFDYQLWTTYRNSAIMSINSMLTVDDFGSSDCTIDRFYYGVRADAASSSLHKLSVKNCDFIGNKYGIKSSSTYTPIISHNTFDDDIGHGDQTGVYLDGCDNYDVLLNEFNDIKYGAYIRNSGENYNLLYKNDFDGVDYPAIANLQNSDFEYGVNIGETGLEIRCNDFDYFEYAISVTGNMQQTQGAATGGSSTLAGNRFYTPTSTSPQSEFIVSTTDPNLAISSYDYYHHITSLCIPNLRTTSKVFLHSPDNEQFDIEDCPDNPDGGKIATKSTNNSLFDLYTAFDDSISYVISDKQTELQQLVDNGNTLILEAMATGMNSNNYNEVISELDLNGMLSDEVVLGLMENTLAPQAAKTQALIENSPLPTKGKEKIDEMTDVDESLRVILLQYQEGENAREIKEAEIARLKNDKAKNTSRLVKYTAYENDSILNTQLIDFLEGQHTVKDNKIALRFAISQCDYNKAGYILNNISELSQTMSIDKQTEFENYSRMQSIAIETEQNYELFDSIINTNSDFLFTMANDTLLPECAQAQVLLEQAGLAEYLPVVYPPQVSMEKTVILQNNQNNYITPEQDYIKIYPNPAIDNLFVEYAVFNYNEDKKYQFEIISQKGQIIKTVNINNPVGMVTINIRNFTPGNYLIKLNNTMTKFTKI